MLTKQSFGMHLEVVNSLNYNSNSIKHSTRVLFILLKFRVDILDMCVIINVQKEC